MDLPAKLRAAIDEMAQEVNRIAISTEDEDTAAYRYGEGVGISKTLRLIEDYKEQ